MTLENDYELTSQEVYRRFISSLPSEVTREYYHRWAALFYGLVADRQRGI